MKPEQKRMVLAMVLSALVLIGWEKFFAPKRIESEKITSKVEKIQNNKNVDINNNPQKNLGASLDNSNKESGNNFDPLNYKLKELKTIVLNHSASQSLSIQNNFNILNFKTDGLKKTFGEILGQSQMRLNIKVNGNVRQVIFDQFEKIGQKIKAYNSIYNITVLYNFTGNRVNYSISSDKKYRYNFTFQSKVKKLSNNQIRQFVVYDSKDVDRFSIDDDDKGDSKVKWIGIDFNYHLFLNVFENAENSLYFIKNNILSSTLVNSVNKINGYFVFISKQYEVLKQFGSKGDNLQMAINFGFFGIVAVPLLKALQFFYKYLGNYGLAIIFLTIVLRLFTFPLQFKSFKSMKKMQVIQPELAKIKEKYKDNPQKVQQETMALFKKAGANPLGGCLPMLLQMPVFFAFYKVLYSAVELVDAPFYFWITDLSVKDPFFVLPVLMTLTMVVQNKLNPTATADPTQKKMMMFMPLIFGFIMKDLPAGLNLYMTVSMGLGSAQQLMVYKYTK